MSTEKSASWEDEWWKEHGRAYAQVVAKAWHDQGFQQHLLANSKKALAEHGITFPNGIELRVVKGGAKTTLELPLPEKPAGLGEYSFDSDSPEVMGCCCCC
jgi:hypothetical protein